MAKQGRPRKVVVEEQKASDDVKDDVRAVRLIDYMECRLVTGVVEHERPRLRLHARA
jgi:hypothetical protein